MGFCAVDAGLCGNKARDLLAVTGDGHLFSALHPIEQLTKFVLRLKGANLPHRMLVLRLA